MKRLVYIGTAVLAGIIAVVLAPFLLPEGTEWYWYVPVFLAGVGVGVAVTPWLVIRPVRWFVRQVRLLHWQDLVSVLIGAFVGVLIAALLSIPLSALPAPWGAIAPTVATILLAVALGAAFWSQRHALDGWRPWGRRADPVKPDTGAPVASGPTYLLDTSAIIDGRIADVAETALLTGLLVVPRFVLAELQQIADAADPGRRARGRRGLDVLARMQRLPGGTTVLDVEAGGPDVDSSLVGAASSRGAILVTTDYNLQRVAELQGVRVLNLHALANALKSSLLPGEDLLVRVIQEGREAGQGVGFLDDGTMIVVEDGRRLIGEEVTVQVTRVLATNAGRMVFAAYRNGNGLGRQAS